MKNNSPRRIYTEQPLTFDPIEIMELLGYSGGKSPREMVLDEIHEWSEGFEAAEVKENPITVSYCPDYDGDTYEVQGTAGRWISHGDQLLFVTWENDVAFCKTLGDFEILAVEGSLETGYSITVKQVEEG